MSSEAISDLRKRAVDVLRANDTGCYTKPAPRLYPHQWNWDSAFAAIGWSHIDQQRAQQEILSLLRGQWKNGMIPHIVFDSESEGYHPNADFWDVSISPDSPDDVPTSGITQPPVLSTAVSAIYRNSKDKSRSIDFLRTVFPRLKQYHAYFHTVRDPDKEGLAYIIHPWESGQDNAPTWDTILSHVEMKHKPEYMRVDRCIVDADQRPSDEDYERYTYLVDVFRKAEYDENMIWRGTSFIVQPVLFNSLLFESHVCLEKIADVLGEDTEEIRTWIESMEKGIRTKLWDDECGRFFDFDVKSHRFIIKDAIGNYMPLFAGIPTQDQADRMIQNLTSHRTYWLLQGYPLCSVSMEEPEFMPKNYWRGLVWISMNWLLIRGLQRYGYSAEAEKLAEKTLDLVGEHGFFEYFHPVTGERYGTDCFSWTAALVLDLITHDVHI